MVVKLGYVLKIRVLRCKVVKSCITTILLTTTTWDGTYILSNTFESLSRFPLWSKVPKVLSVPSETGLDPSVVGGRRCSERILSVSI